MITDASEVTSLKEIKVSDKGGEKGKKMAYKDTSCFQTGLWADKRLKRGCWGNDKSWEDNLADARDEGGEGSLLFLLFFLLPWSAALDPIAPRAERAFEEVRLDKLVGVPLTSLSDSRVGSLLTNSFCSN